MFRFASGQLVLLALTACVCAQSSGFLKPGVSSKFRNVSPVVSVMQQLQKPQSLSEKEGKKERSLSEKQTPNLWTQTKEQMKRTQTKAPKKKLPVFPTQTQPPQLQQRAALWGAVAAPAAATAPQPTQDPTQQLKDTLKKQAAEIKALREKLPHGGYANAIEQKTAVRKIANAAEDTALQRAWIALETRHKLETNKSKAAMDRYDTILTKRYACNDAFVKENLKKKIASQRRITAKALYMKHTAEKQIFLRRQKCMQKELGDQSKSTWNWDKAYIRDFGKKRNFVSAKQALANVGKCMATAKLLEAAPMAQGQVLTLSEEAAVQTQIGHFPEMLEQAHGVLEGLFLYNTVQNSEQKQMEDTWEIDTRDLKQCEQSVGTDENIAKAFDFKLKLVKADSQKVDVEKPTTVVSHLKDALAAATKLVAEASEAVAKEHNA